MRITNKVMQNNALVNINKNKELQDSLNTQLSTGKKIYRPSEDPVTAIRALRLRSDVSQVSQYYKKNVPDANSWLELTESAVKTTIAVVTDMIGQCEKGSNDTLTIDDRQTIINSMKQLRDEVYATGDADYAGRYIFTGYRTDTSLSFTENTMQQFNITQRFTGDDLDEETYVDTANLKECTEANFEAGGTSLIAEQDVEPETFYRVRLAYNNLDAANAPTSITVGGVNIANITVENDKTAAYKNAANGAGTYFIPSTGEIVFDKNVYTAIKNSTDSFDITYSKTNWQDGDLRPQHYFYCTTTDEKGVPVEYNPEYLTDGKVDQEIEYQIGFSQFIRINTSAGEIYQHDIGRDVDELINLANQLTEVENTQSTLKDMIKDTTKYSTAQVENINRDLAAANKAVTYIKDQLQKKFSSCIGSMQSYLDDANESLTVVGNRSARLELIDNRLESQTTTFKTLQSENEDADATEVAVQLSSAQVNYEAALMATSEMIQKTLLNYL